MEEWLDAEIRFETGDMFARLGGTCAVASKLPTDVDFLLFSGDAHELVANFFPWTIESPEPARSGRCGAHGFLSIPSSRIRFASPADFTGDIATMAVAAVEL